MKKALTGAVLAAGMVVAMGQGQAKKAVGIQKGTYLKLFLDKKDLKPMRMVQDTRKKGPDPRDAEFKKYKGITSGFSVWMGRTDHTVWRLVDIRWVFPSADRKSTRLNSSHYS
mgnify:CR=1 FL=1